MNDKKIRVLVVDDSQVMRDMLIEILNSDPSIEVIGTASDGRDAVRKAFILKPDVITMDLNMPIMDGFEAIEKIMQEQPTPIIAVSGIDVSVIVKSLGIGAIDFITVGRTLGEIAGDVIEKVKIASRIKPLRRIKFMPKKKKTAKFKVPAKAGMKVVVVGSSTGGPQALTVLLSDFPHNFPGCVIVVQHMADGFVDGLVEWLNYTSPLKVTAANNGQFLEPGSILVAPTDHHLKITGKKTVLFIEPDEKSDFYIPSINVTMRSVASAFGSEAIGVIMTGMGNDGADGIKRIKKKGGMTIAQDEATSVVFGMNKAAIESGAVDYVCPLSDITSKILYCMEE